MRDAEAVILLHSSGFNSKYSVQFIDFPNHLFRSGHTMHLFHIEASIFFPTMKACLAVYLLHCVLASDSNLSMLAEPHFFLSECFLEEHPFPPPITDCPLFLSECFLEETIGISGRRLYPLARSHIWGSAQIPSDRE